MKKKSKSYTRAREKCGLLIYWNDRLQCKDTKMECVKCPDKSRCSFELTQAYNLVLYIKKGAKYKPTFSMFHIEMKSLIYEVKKTLEAIIQIVQGGILYEL